MEGRCLPDPSETVEPQRFARMDARIKTHRREFEINAEKFSCRRPWSRPQYPAQDYVLPRRTAPVRLARRIPSGPLGLLLRQVGTQGLRSRDKFQEWRGGGNLPLSKLSTN